MTKTRIYIRIYLLTLVVCLAVYVLLYLKDSTTWTAKRSWPSHHYYSMNASVVNQIFASPNPPASDPHCQIIRAHNSHSYPKLIQLHNNKSIDFHCLNQKSNSTKLILIWNNLFRSDDLFTRTDFRCPIGKCEITNDRDSLKRSHLVLVNLNDDIDKLPGTDNDLKWAAVIYRPFEISSPNVDSARFDISITYKSDSSMVPIHYREFNIRWNSRPRVLNHTGARLTAIAAIVDGDCSDLELLQHLSKYIRVDIYGKCGPFECPDEKKDNCLHYIANKYMFLYVSEPLICSDYVTDKFFQVLTYDIVPIVLHEFDHDSYVPRGSFIDASKFSNLKDLAAYLGYLSRNETEYRSYFEWKLGVSLDEGRTNPMPSVLCDLCAALHLGIETGKPTDLSQFESKKACFKLNIFDVKYFDFKQPYPENGQEVETDSNWGLGIFFNDLLNTLYY